MRDVYITMPIAGLFQRLLLAAVVPGDVSGAFQRCHWAVDTEATRWRDRAECVADQQIEMGRSAPNVKPNLTAAAECFVWLGMPRQGTKRGWSVIADHLGADEATVFHQHVIRPVSVQPRPGGTGW